MTKTSKAASDTERGIPDLEFIKKNVPIADVARALDIRVASNTTAHCWRPGGHQNGDRTPSVWFSKRSNRGKCNVCDRFTWSNVDLVQAVLNLSTADAINWISDRWNVPRIAKRRPATNRAVVPGRVGCGSAVEQLMRSGLFAALSHPAKVLLFVLSEFAKEHNAKLSYRTLQRVTGIGSRNTLKAALDSLEHIGLLKITRGPVGDGMRQMSGYRLTWEDAGLQSLMRETHSATIREIKAEMELSQADREKRTYLSTASVQLEYRKEAGTVHSLNHLSKKEGGKRA